MARQETAVIISMALLPWTFKIFWGPIIDSFQFAAMGLRRPWILMAQLMMAGTLLLASTNQEITDSGTISLLVWVFFIHNCFASLQDVATDAMAMDLLRPDERGRANGLMWGSKLVGISLGGGLLATVLVRYGLTAGMRIQCGVVLLIMLLPLLVRERVGERLLPWTKGRRMAPANASVIKEGTGFLDRLRSGPLGVLSNLRRAFALQTTAAGALFAFLMVVCEGFHDANTPAVFTQTLGWSAEQYARTQAIWGTLGKIVGALAGGLLCDRVGRRAISGVAMSLTGLFCISFGLTAGSWLATGYPAWLFIPLIQGSLAMTAVAAFSLFMKISWTAAAATQFTLFMTLSNMGFALGPYLTRLHLSDSMSYVVCGLVAMAPILVIPLMRPGTVESRKQAELSAEASA